MSDAEDILAEMKKKEREARYPHIGTRQWDNENKKWIWKD